jgi:hypothetical protein
MPPLAEDDNGRDEKGRFRKGFRGGPGGAKHEYIRDRARLYDALRQQLSAEKLQTLWQRLYARALKGDIRAAALLLSYRLGKVPDAMSARELYPAARVTREPALSLEALSGRLQALLEDFEAGKVSADDARMARDILTSLVQAKQGAELERKLDELWLIMERADNGQPSS